MRETDNRTRVLAVQQQHDETIADIALVQPHRKYVREGVFRFKEEPMEIVDEDSDDEVEQEEEEKGKKYCFLFNDLFLISECIGRGKEKQLTMENCFELPQTFVKDDASPVCLQVINPRQTVVIKFISESEKQMWKDALLSTTKDLIKLSKNAEARAQVDIKFDAGMGEWVAELCPAVCCRRIDSTTTDYRELVLDATQKELSRLMEEEGTTLAKLKVTPSKKDTPSKRKSVFKRFADSLTTPKSAKDGRKRATTIVGTQLDFSSVAEVPSTPEQIPGPAKVLSPSVATSHNNATVPSEPSTPLSMNMAHEPSTPVLLSEPTDGVTALTKHIDFLRKQLEEIRKPSM
jgi:hypothetical protein